MPWWDARDTGAADEGRVEHRADTAVLAAAMMDFPMREANIDAPLNEGALMIRASCKIALVLSVALVGACQTNPMPQLFQRGSAIEGQWASGDGVSVTAFRGGQFTTRFTKNNEVLAQGTYIVTGNDVAMQWLSLARQQQLSANCSLTGASTMRCSQPGGSGFDLARTG